VSAKPAVPGVVEALRAELRIRALDYGRAVGMGMAEYYERQADVLDRGEPLTVWSWMLPRPWVDEYRPPVLVIVYPDDTVRPFSQVHLGRKEGSP
jgi:hypothetical protein